MNRRSLLAGAAASLVMGTVRAAAPASPGSTQPSEIPAGQPDGLNPPGIRVAGIRMVPVVGGKYKVWTKKIGSSPVKVLLLHGGPGVSHEYLEALESFLPQAGIEMYYYDQLGCNNSDQPDDPGLWTLDRYTTEVEEVRRGLGLEHFVLYGHSWGGILAIEYALHYQQHLPRIGDLGYDGGRSVISQADRFYQAPTAARHARPPHGARSERGLRFAGVPEDHDGRSVSQNDLPDPTLAGAGVARISSCE